MLLDRCKGIKIRVHHTASTGSTALTPRGVRAKIRIRCLVPGVLVLLAAVGADTATAQTVSGTPELTSARAYDGPPPPVAPATITRDAEGRASVRAIRLTAPLRIDGQLDEGVYANNTPMSSFVQAEPEEGQPATQQTDVWLMFDDDNVYVSALIYDAHLERMIANEMRHDASAQIAQNEYLTASFDTFYDRRNGYSFTVTPIGGRLEAQYANERQYLSDWNGVWEFKSGRFDGGWTTEMAIPFKSLRYQPGRSQIWGFQIQRMNRWKNELTFLTPIPAAKGSFGFMQSSLAATVVDLEVPPPGRNLEIKPYAIADLTTNLQAAPRVSNDLGGDVGVDIKYGLTQGLAADFTYNTDFAQVEADEQQVNLTRFSLFFPEKRDFFLENAGTFSFGGAATGLGFGGSRDVPTIFYSRRIGLNGTNEVPLQAGGRLTGRVGPYSLGLIDIRSDDEPASGAKATNFIVARVKRDILRRSAVGVLFTGRSIAQSGTGTNETFGVDGTFSFFTNLGVNAYWAKTRTSGLTGDDTSYRTQLDYAGDRYGVEIDHLAVGDNFNPEVGFVRRDDIRKTYALMRFSPRPGSPSVVRKYSYIGTGTYLENGDGRVDLREANGEFSIEFQSSDKVTASYNRSYEFIPLPFRIAPQVTVPVGGYDTWTARASFSTGQHRPLFGNISVERGTFYGGHRTSVGISRGRVEITPRFNLEPSFSVNRVDLPQGAFTAHLVGSRITYTMTPLMFVSALVQYNSGNNGVASNVRLRWEYQPGSELFVVYNEQRDTVARGFPNLQNRALIVKINRLLRF